MNPNNLTDPEEVVGGSGEHLVCEFCEAEFDALAKYQQHKAVMHRDEEAALERKLDEQVKETFPGSDAPTSTNPGSGMGDPDDAPGD